MNELQRTALVVDDEALIAMMLSEMLEDMGFEICGTAATAVEAVQLAEAHRPDLILMDVRLKGEEDGVFAARRIHDIFDAKVVFITGSREPDTVARIKTDHPSGILFKPILSGQLEAAVQIAL
jgi:two-component system, response regulator PdtaR